MIKKITLFLLIVGSSTYLYAQNGDEEPEISFKSSTEITSFDSTQADSAKREPITWSRRTTGLKQYGVDITGFHHTVPGNTSELYSVFPNLPMIHFNRVNGLFLGVKKERMQWISHDDTFLHIPNIQVHGMLGYATAAQELHYTFGLEKTIGWQENLLLGGELFNATGTEDSWRIGFNENSFSALTLGYDFLDYYKQTGWGAYLLARSNRLLEGGLAFINSRYISASRTTGWALLGAGDRYRENPAVNYDIIQSSNREWLASWDDAQIASLYISGAFNPKQRILSHYFTFSLNGMLELADPGIGSSDFDYTKYTGELISYFNFEPGGVLKHRLRASTVTGTAPNFKQLYLGGVGSLRALPYKVMGAGNQMLLSNLELQFGHPNYSDGGWIDFDDFYLSLFLDSGWIDQIEEGAPSTDFSMADVKHNAGLGLGTNIIRGEVAWDLDRPRRTPVLWLRLNPTF